MLKLCQVTVSALEVRVRMLDLRALIDLTVWLNGHLLPAQRYVEARAFKGQASALSYAV